MGIGVGLVGFGLSARVFHLPFLQDHAGYDVRGIVSSQREDIARLAPSAACYDELENLLRAPGIELVVITAPNHLHYEFCKRSLEAGKHVVVEKPFVVASAQGEELIKLATAQQRCLTVYHNRRYDADFLTVRRLVEAGTLGRVRSFSSHYDRYRPLVAQERWREQAAVGCGTVYDLGSHLLDQAVVLFGKPHGILADIACQRANAKAADYFHMLLAYADVKVILHGSSYALGSLPRFVLQGERGSFIKYGLDGQEASLRDQTSPCRPSHPGFGVEDSALWGQLTLMSDEGPTTSAVPSERGSYVRFYDELQQSLRAGQAPAISADEALTTIRLIEKAYQSNEEKRFIACP